MAVDQRPFELSKDEEESATAIATVPSSLPSAIDVADPIADGNYDQIFAADYDPSQDRREEEARMARHAAAALADGTGEGHMHEKAPVTIESEEEEDDDDDDDVDDMFALGSPKPKKTKTKKVSLLSITMITVKLTKQLFRQSRPATTIAPTIALADVAADSEGYYQIVLGEALDGGRYQVFSTLGKDMFSAVVRARIISGEGVGKEVAIKIIRAQETMSVPYFASFESVM